MASDVPIIGLFSGAGGLEIGAAWAGADVRLCVDNDPIACQMLRQNPDFHSGEILEADVATLNGRTLRKMAGLGRHDPCIVIGGPPCQPFSKASYWTDPGDDSRYRRARARGEVAPRPTPITEARPDERRTLVQEFWRLVLETRADGFLFENVPSITHPRSRSILEALVESAQSAKYEVILLRVNAVHYGVPQCRHRVVLLGLRRGRPSPPTPTHSESADTNLYTLPAVTAGEALSRYHHSKYAEPEEVVKGRWVDQLREIPPGQNYKALTAWAGHPTPVFEAETRFWHFLLKLSPDLPSWTIPANPGPWVGPFHWESRRLRIVELAALQSFPHGYRFTGTRAEPRSTDRQRCAAPYGTQNDRASSQRTVERTAQVQGQKQGNSPMRCISLFSGCGGLDLGLTQAGFKIILASDNNPVCAASYTANFPGTPFHDGSVTELDELLIKSLTRGESAEGVDLLVGGPPCPPYSKSRFYRKTKPRALEDKVGQETLEGYLKLLGLLRPKAFLLENVAGMAYKVHLEALNSTVGLS